jgi:hypothetical protein
MKRSSFALSAVLAASLVLPTTPATADTYDVGFSSASFTWLDGEVTDVAFDPAGRMWVWNVFSSEESPHGFQTNVFRKDSDGNWDHSFRFRLKKHNPFKVAFSRDGRVFSVDAFNCVLHTAKLKANGKTKSVTKLKFRMSFCPSRVQPIDGRRVVLISSDQIREYKWPMSSRSKPVRAIEYGLNDITDERVGSDGAVYFAVGDGTNQSVHVFLPTQSGDSSPGRAFTIHADYSPEDIRGMSFTPEGELALKMGSNVALFPTTTEGDNMVPETYYRFGTEPSNGGGGLAFDTNGLMAIVEHAHELPVRLFFESDCRRSTDAIC